MRAAITSSVDGTGPRGFLSLLGFFLLGFLETDPRVITAEERRMGKTAQKF
jgi:hypothetical protein